MRMLSTRSSAIVICIGATAVLVTGTAYATWRATGAGSGAGNVGTAVAVTVSTNATAGTRLQPGSTGDLVITATNPNAFDVQVTALTLGTVTGCTSPALSLTLPSTTYLPLTIPHNTSSVRLVLTGALGMGASSSDCQGATLDLTLVPTLRSRS